MPAADASMVRYAQSYLDSIAERSPDIDGKVHELVAALLPTGRCPIERVAEHLGCDRRTIYRHLAARGLTFSDIIDEQRAELVVRLIEDQPADCRRTARVSARSALARGFRERFGQSITQWRSQSS